MIDGRASSEMVNRSDEELPKFGGLVRSPSDEAGEAASFQELVDLPAGVIVAHYSVVILGNWAHGKADEVWSHGISLPIHCIGHAERVSCDPPVVVAHSAHGEDKNRCRRQNAA